MNEPQPMTSGPTTKTQNGLSITSLVLGVFSPICLLVITGIPAIITGHIAYGRAKNQPQLYGGAGMALAGLILGYLSIASTVVIAAIVFSVSFSNKSLIVGKWQHIGGNETLEFFKDGTISATSPTVAGKYSFVENDRIKLELGGIAALAGPVIMSVSISGGELSLTDSKGKVSRYYRIKARRNWAGGSSDPAIQCVNNMKMIGLAARIWANDHNELYPPNFLTMSNELYSPKILVCPNDSTKSAAQDWSQFSPSKNLTYEFLTPGAKEADILTQTAFRCPIHNNSALGDGSVQQAPGRRR